MGVMNGVFDRQSGDIIEMPNEMMLFLTDIEEVCKKHGFSISHEDVHGAFTIQKYSDFNIKWLKSAMKDY